MTDKQNEVGLDVCPFCGCTGAVYSHRNIEDSEKPYSVRCFDCTIKTGYFATKAEARASWNRRAVKESGERSQESEWTNEVPTEEGWYWACYGDGALCDIELVQIVYDDDLLPLTPLVLRSFDVAVALNRKEHDEPFLKLLMTLERYLDCHYVRGWRKIPTPPLPGREGK